MRGATEVGKDVSDGDKDPGRGGRWTGGGLWALVGVRLRLRVGGREVGEGEGQQEPR